jgi:hypothetical protein
VTRSLKKNPFVANHLLQKIDKLNTKEEKEMGERRELNPRMVDSQSTALIHLATSAPFTPSLYFYLFLIFPILISNLFRFRIFILFS